MAGTFETMVRTYKDTGDYQKDQKKLAKDGWMTTAMVERKPRAGVGRIITLGLVAAVRPPKPELVVTYQRAIADKAAKPQRSKGASSASLSCPKCGQGIPDNARFCNNCGQKLQG
jgi:hypothetical protein